MVSDIDTSHYYDNIHHHNLEIRFTEIIMLHKLYSKLYLNAFV